MGQWSPVVATLDHRLIVAEYKSGKSVADIAELVHAKDYHVRAVLKKSGITIIKGRFKSSYIPHNKTTTTDQQIIDCVKSGKSFRDTSIELDCSIHVVRQRCHKHGISSPGFSFREATNLKAQVGEEVYTLLSNKAWLFEQYVVKHKPTRTIATEIGCGKKAVLTALSRHNITVRKGPQNRGKFVSAQGKCHDFWCDSYWEWSIACRMDDDDRVLKFIKDPFPLAYIDKEGNTRTYRPDFLVLTRTDTYLVEVKPDGLLPYVERKTKAGFCSGLKYFVLNCSDDFPWGN